VDVTMPQLGETVTEGTITRWLKQVGERVEADEPLFEVSTDKVDSEVPAPSGGVVTEILVAEGETVEVGTRLAVVGDASASPAAASAPEAPVEPPAAETPPAPPAPAPPAPAPPAPAPPAPAPPAPAPPAPAPPAPAPAAASAPEPITFSASAAPEPAPAPERVDAEEGGTEALTSPIVRRLVAERGLDVSAIQGSGPGGRITRKDVLDAAQHAPAPPEAPAAAAATATAATVETPSAPTPPAPPPSAPAGPAAPAAVPAPLARPAPAPAAGGARVARDEVIPFDNIRRRTAEHMVQSLATSAHVYTSIEVDFERVERVRAAHRGAWKASEGFSLTYLPFIARAFCDTVHEFPKVNASVGDDALVVHHDVNLSIAVDLDFEGLVAPVIRDADGKRLRLLAREVHDLAERARTKKLVPDDVLGGTFTITNPGPFGTYATLPIINQPQVAILSTDGIKKRPVVVTGPDGDDAIAIHHTGLLVLTWDHRAFDGAYAAAFLRGMRAALEQHNWEDELD
jgi:pyruvate dehydrogenase E2 component (dihydrolipoamide acetyltransferase)